jgi:hypothetical protein
MDSRRGTSIIFTCEVCHTKQFVIGPNGGWVMNVPDEQVHLLMAAVLRGDVDDVQGDQ